MLINWGLNMRTGNYTSSSSVDRKITYRTEIVKNKVFELNLNIR